MTYKIITSWILRCVFLYNIQLLVILLFRSLWIILLIRFAFLIFPNDLLWRKRKTKIFPFGKQTREWQKTKKNKTKPPKIVHYSSDEVDKVVISITRHTLQVLLCMSFLQIIKKIEGWKVEISKSWRKLCQTNNLVRFESFGRQNLKGIIVTLNWKMSW